MTGWIWAPDGRCWQLPVLLSWEILRASGEASDSFTVRFAYAPEQAQALRAACRFSATEDGMPVFTGVVDEFEVTASDAGLLAEITGRGMDALLRDNQTRAQYFALAQLPDILKTFVTPLGITKVDADAGLAVSNFAVDSGDSCYIALAGFCRHAGGITPRFLADGTLQLRAAPTMHKRQITAATAVSDLRWRMCRYGVVSEQVMVDSKTGQAQAVKNEPFLALGGSARKVVLVSGKTLRAVFRTAAQRIASSEEELNVLEITMPGAFLAEPGDQVQVTLPAFGIAGTYRVHTVRTSAGAGGLACTLYLS